MFNSAIHKSHVFLLVSSLQTTYNVSSLHVAYIISDILKVLVKTCELSQPNLFNAANDSECMTRRNFSVMSDNIQITC